MPWRAGSRPVRKGVFSVNVSRRVYLRPVRAEYFLNRLKPFQGFGKETRNNFRRSAGVNVTYGRPQ